MSEQSFEERFDVVQTSEWKEEKFMKYRVILGRENAPFLGANNWCTWEESWEYAGKNARPYKRNFYWGHYCMKEDEAMRDFHERSKKLYI